MLTAPLFHVGIYPGACTHHSGELVLGRLLESEKRTKRSAWGALVSIVAHSTAIGIAVAATAHARLEDKSPPEIVRWVEPPPPRAQSPTVPAPRKPSTASPSTPALAPIALRRIDVVLPPIELALPNPSDDFVSPARGESPGAPEADSAGGSDSAEPLSADQVERQVSLRHNTRSPRYPAALRNSGVEGEVIALFVVSEAGRVEPGTVRFARSDHVLFEVAVREALEGMRFNAAEVGGKRVRQLVQMPFVFTLTR